MKRQLPVTGHRRPERGRATPLPAGLALVLAACAGAFAPAAAQGIEPANPNASPRARAVLQYLYELPKGATNRLVSGQLCGAAIGPGIQAGNVPFSRREYDYIHNVSGQYPALMGADYCAGYFEHSNPVQSTMWYTNINAGLIAHSRAGGLTVITTHQFDPRELYGNGGQCYSKDLPPDMPVLDIARLYTPGTVEYNNFRVIMDIWAAGLRELETNDVVVLWRPYNEATNSGKWWCRQPANKFIALYRYTFDYLTTTKGLNNLLWFYDGIDTSNPTNGYTLKMTHYPGDAYVDLVGMTWNTGYLTRPWTQTQHPYPEKVFIFAECNILGETGERDCDYTRIVAWWKQNAPYSVGFMCWDRDAGPYERAIPATLNTFYNDPWMLNLGEFDPYPSQPAPNAPGDLSAVPLPAGSVALTWADNSADEAGFKLDRRQSGATDWQRIATPAPNATSHTDVGLPPGTKFYYKVKAWNTAGGNSPYSNVADVTTPSPAPAETANPNAWPEAKAILAYLEDLPNRPDKRVISGQVHGMPWRNSYWQIEETYRQWGHRVGIIHGFVSDQAVSSTYNWKAKLQDFIDHWNAGGLVSFSAEFYDPIYKTRGTQTPYTDLERVITPGTPEYQEFVKQADHFADRLQILKDAGVVVLFIPFTEVTIRPTTKWWAGRPPEDFHALYRWIFRYYTEVKKLDNLLWVYDGSTDREYRNIDYWPGNAYVDIAGVNYSRWKPHPERTDYYDDEYAEMMSTGRPFAWAEGFNFETNSCPDFTYDRVLEGIKKFWPRTTYFMAYNSYETDGEYRDFSLHHPYKHAERLLNDPWIVSRDEINWRAYLDRPPAPAAPSSLSATARSASAIRLEWTDNARDEDGFRIDRRQSGTTVWAQIAALPAHTTTHTDTGLPADTKFYYTVLACRGSDLSDRSELSDATTCPAPHEQGLPPGAVWRYRLGTSAPSQPAGAWRQASFDDSGWAQGQAPFGYGPLEYGTDLEGAMQGVCTCVFLRRALQLESPAQITALLITVEFDDGFVLWLNGEEVARANVDDLAHDAVSSGYVAGSSEQRTVTLTGGALPALGAENVLALQLVNAAAGSGDLMGDVQITFTTERLPAAADADADGMPDEWEAAYLSDLTDPSDRSGQADPDGDGLSNYAEWVAGTEPADETRNLKLETGIQGGQILVSFETLVAAGPGYAGLTRHYQLQCCTSPAAADWTPVPGYEDIAATGNPITCEATASGPALCYRTRVWLAD